MKPWYLVFGVNTKPLQDGRADSPQWGLPANWEGVRWRQNPNYHGTPGDEDAQDRNRNLDIRERRFSGLADEDDQDEEVSRLQNCLTW